MVYVILDSETGRYVVTRRITVKAPELARMFKTEKQAKAYRYSNEMSKKRYGVIQVEVKPALYTREEIVELGKVRKLFRRSARKKKTVII